jgi:hypothetical protein
LAFKTSNLGFNLKAGILQLARPLSEIDAVDYSTGRIFGFIPHVKVEIHHKDSSVLRLEAFGVTFTSAKALALQLKTTVTE